jgi:hypothetical protein
MTFSANRVVAVLTPLVFAPLAGGITAYVAAHFPGLNINESQVQAIFITGSTIALAKAALWLKGWQQWEKGNQLVPEDVAHDLALEDAGIGASSGEPVAAPPFVADAPAVAPGPPAFGSAFDPDWDEDLDPDADDALATPGLSTGTG